MSIVKRNPENVGKAWTVEEACDWYRRAKEKLGRRPTVQEMMPYHMTFHRLFDGLPNFYAANGDEARGPGRPTEAERKV